MATIRIAVLITILSVFGAGSASAFSIMIGDNDGFGFSDALVPDGAGLLNINLPEDRRSAAEAAGVNGVQQTDFYSANFNPLPETFDVIFSVNTDLLSGVFTVDMGGFQATELGLLEVLFNGVLQPGLFDFQDGAFATAVRMFALDAATIASINATDEFRVTINRNSSNDAIAFDYFQLDGAPVPEPSAVLLFSVGLLVTGQALRRARH